MKKIIFSNLFVFLIILFGIETYFQFNSSRNPENDVATYDKELTFIYKRFSYDDNALMRGFFAHPYFAYVLNKYKGVNNFGFDTPDDFPYLRKQDELVVGVFGASVAQQFAHHLMDTTDGVKMRVCGDEKKLKFINFAIQTHRQPQPFNIFHFYGDQVDVAINMDGNNEMRYFPANGFPREYPSYYALFFMLTEKKKADLERIFYLQKWQFRIISLSEKVGFLNKSEFYFKFNLSLIRFIQGFVKSAEQRIIEMSVGPIKGDYLRRDDLESLRVWKKYNKLQSAVAKQMSVPLISFIQPTQYLEDSKIFSEEERKIAILDNPERVASLRKHWIMLGDSVSEMQKAGVNLVDFRRVFAGISEPLFVDVCCHVNSRGNEIMKPIVLEKIREQLKSVNCQRYK